MMQVMTTSRPETTGDDLDLLAAVLAELRARVAPMVLARQERRREGATPAERLSTPQHLTLLALADGPLTMSALAAATGVASSTATRMVQALTRGGWVAPADPGGEADRRRRPVTLTPEGREVMDGASDTLRLRLRGLFSHLDADERAAILAGVRALEKAVQLDEERRDRAAAWSADSISSAEGDVPGSGVAEPGRMPSRITPR